MEKQNSPSEKGITIYLYYNGDYAMKLEGLTRERADELLLEYNNPKSIGWLARNKEDRESILF